MDRLMVLESPLAYQGRPSPTPDACLAIQAKPGSPPPHPAPAAQGHELACLRGWLASRGPLDGVVHRRGGRSVGSGATHNTRWPTLLFAAGNPDGADPARSVPS